MDGSVFAFTSRDRAATSNREGALIGTESGTFGNPIVLDGASSPSPTGIEEDGLEIVGWTSSIEGREEISVRVKFTFK